MQKIESTLSKLSENCDFCGYSVRAVYVNHLGKPFGARFIHPGGLAADLVYFNSLPQLSLCFQTLPFDDMGEAHALEHIVLGKGKKGKKLSLLFDMCLAENTAATYPDLTNYQFSCAGGDDAFWRLLESFSDALISPDFADIEAQREIYNLDASPAKNGFSLEEKGTVYNEMVSAAEKPSYSVWRKLSKLAYGENHPLARESGGAPEEMRKLTPQLLRKFHAENYRLDKAASLIAALPPHITPEQFLEKLSALMGRQPSSQKATMPDFSHSKPEIWIGRYPSGDSSTPQDAIFAWRPKQHATYDEALALSLFIEILAGGDTSYLHRDLVDSASLKYDCGIAAVGGFAEDPPSNIAGVYAAALPPEKITEEALTKVRDVIAARVSRMSCGDDLDETREKAASLLSSRRRVMLKFLDNPPKFGDRGGGIMWHRHLQALEETGGFIRPVAQLEAIARLEERIRADDNLWRETAEKFNLLELPFCCAAKPDAELLKVQDQAKEIRLAEGLKAVETRFSKTGPDALKLQYEASQRQTQELEREFDSVEKPPFVSNPPLTLDDGITVSRTVLECGVPADAASAGQTPFTDINLFFNLAALDRKDFVYLPIITSALSEIGVTTASGEKLDYSAMIERWRTEIYALSSFTSSNSTTGRAELALSASASCAEEIPSAAAWLENCLLRSSLSVESAGRLRDVVDESIQEVRAMFTRSEEHWARDAASGLFQSDNALMLSMHSPFTELFHLERLRAMLDEESVTQVLSALDELKNGASIDAGGPVEQLPQWMKESFTWHIRHFPKETSRQDTAVLVSEYMTAVKAGPEGAIAGLKAALKKLLRADNVRAAAAGAPDNAQAALKLVNALLKKLPSSSPHVVATTPVDIVLANVKNRKPEVNRLVHCALLNEAGSSGAIVARAAGISYKDTDEESLWTFLALKLIGGGGPHALFMKTWEAGLAYSNGAGANPASGKFSYYAERCPDLALTMAFAASVVSQTQPEQKHLADYALSNCFNDYRGGDTPSSRAYSAICDLADGITPDIVRRFKKALLELGKRPDAAKQMSARITQAAGRVIPLKGKPLSQIAGAKAFAIAPERLVGKYSQWLKEQGEPEPLVVLYPRDFWVM